MGLVRRFPGGPTEEEGPRERRFLAKPLQAQSQPTKGPSYRSEPLRANIFSKVTYLFCRIPLPTLSLLSRGFSPWSPDADIGTIYHRDTRPGRVFTGRRDGHLRHRQCRATLESPIPLLAANASTDSESLKRRSKLPGWVPPASPVQDMRCRHFSL